MEYEPAAGRRRVDLLGKNLQPDIASLQVRRRLDRLPN